MTGDRHIRFCERRGCHPPATHPLGERLLFPWPGADGVLGLSPPSDSCSRKERSEPVL